VERFVKAFFIFFYVLEFLGGVIAKAARKTLKIATITLMK